MWGEEAKGSLIAILGLLTALTVITSSISYVQANTPAQSLDEFLRANPDLGEYFELVFRKFAAKLDWTQSTLFAFSNQALNEFRRTKPEQLDDYTMLYHLADTVILTQDMVEDSREERKYKPGCLPVWITIVGPNVYVNSAKIVHGDHRVKIGKNQLEHIIHVIDKVLEPTIPKVKVTSSTINNPDAKKFLDIVNDYTINGNYKKVFSNQVQAKKGYLRLFQDGEVTSDNLVAEHADIPVKNGVIDSNEFNSMAVRVVYFRKSSYGKFCPSILDSVGYPANAHLEFLAYGKM